MLRAAISAFNPRVTSYSKPDVTVAPAWTTANSPQTIFTVTGTVLVTCVGSVTTPLTSTSSTGTIALGTTSGTGTIIAATTVNGTKLHTTGFVWADTTASSSVAALPATSGWFVCTGNIILTIATNNITAGGLNIYAIWFPLSAGASVA